MVVDFAAREAQADRLFHALADATRRDIVSVVLDEPQSVSSLASRYPFSFAAVQKHVAVLERAGLVSKQARGRQQIVSGDPSRLREAHAMLDQIEVLWRRRLERFERLLDEP
jgi:DNA-binding transcriptional ArsR family regulator